MRVRPESHASCEGTILRGDAVLGPETFGPARASSGAAARACNAERRTVRGCHPIGWNEAPALAAHVCPRNRPCQSKSAYTGVAAQSRPIPRRDGRRAGKFFTPVNASGVEVGPLSCGLDSRLPVAYRELDAARARRKVSCALRIGSRSRTAIAAA